MLTRFPVALESAWRDAVCGTRALRREPAFALTALITLTLGVAITTTAFTVVDTELWKPLPFPDANRLVAVHAIGPGVLTGERVSAPDLVDWQRQARLAEYAVEYAAGPNRRVLRRATAESVTVHLVTSNFFAVLGLQPRLGRAFVTGQDDRNRAVVGQRMAPSVRRRSAHRRIDDQAR